MKTKKELYHCVSLQIKRNSQIHSESTGIWFAVRDAAFNENKFRLFIRKFIGCDVTDMTNAQAKKVYDWLSQ